MKCASLKFLLVASLAMSAAACAGPAEREARALKKGDDYLAAGNLEKARVEYSNALQLEPNDPRARYANGVIRQKLGMLREAGQFYQGTLDVQFDHLQARTELSRIYLLSHMPDKAIEVLSPALEAHPANADLLVIRGAARLQLHDDVGALEDSELAVKLDAANETAVASLAGIYSNAGRAADASKLLEAAISTNAKTVDLRVALAENEDRQGHSERAETLMREAVAKNPKDGAQRVRLAQLLSRHGKMGEAEQVLRDGIGALPTDKNLKAALLSLLGSSHGLKAAQEEAERMSAADPSNVDLRLSVGELYGKNSDFVKAEAVFRDVIRREGSKPGGIAARGSLAEVKRQMRDLPAAQALVTETLQLNPRDLHGLTLRGQLRLDKGDFKGAVEDLRAVVGEQPMSEPVLLSLARAHLGNNEPVLAEEALRHAAEIAPTDPSVHFELAQLFLQTGQADAAKRLLQNIAKERAADREVQSLLFRACLATRDVAGAEGALQMIRALDPASALTHQYAGMIAEANNKMDAALTEYRAALVQEPKAEEPLLASIRLLTRAKRTEDALKLLDEVASKVPQYALPLNVRGEVLLADRKFDLSDAAFKAALARAPHWWLPQRGLAYVLAARGDTAGAVRLLQAALPTIDEPSKLHGAMAQLSDISGNTDAAIGEYEEVLKLEPKSYVVANNLAILLLAHRSDPASLKRALDLTLPFASTPNPQFVDTYAWAKIRNGDAATALPLLEKVASEHANVTTVQYHLALAQVALGQTDKAKISLKLALASGAKFVGMEDARTMLAQLSAGH
jgi:tetratricopeptide (TPR) repeat protein